MIALVGIDPVAQSWMLNFLAGDDPEETNADLEHLSALEDDDWGEWLRPAVMFQALRDDTPGIFALSLPGVPA